VRGGRLCEVTEIATTGDKMPMEEVLSNTGWTSADAEQIFVLRIRPAMCGSGFTGAHRHHHLAHLAHLVVASRAGRLTTDPMSCTDQE